MKILIIHHLQKIWESSYNKMGTSFENLAWEFIEYLQENDFDRIILTQFEAWEAQEEHINSGLCAYVDQWEEYGYGWTLDEDYDNLGEYGIDYCEGGYHSDYVLLDDWMRDLKGHEVYISGSFDGECVEDLEVALKFLEIPFNRINELII